VLSIIVQLLELYFFVLLLRIVLSWFPLPQEGFFASAARVLYAVTEPVLAPLRAVLPPVRMGGMALDLSPLVLLLGIQVLISVLGR
jgi:YggT family protein